LSTNFADVPNGLQFANFTPRGQTEAGLATKKRTQKLCRSLVNCFGFQSQWANGSRASYAGGGGYKTLL
jgi:hypothetical protein